MTLRPLPPLLLIGLALSCGGGSRSASMSFADFKATLERMKTPFEEPCPECHQSGKVLDPDTGNEVKCPTCEGTGMRKGVRGPTVADFEAAFGKPERVESRPADLVWEYWFFPCREGTVRLPAFLDEQPGDEVRVVTGEPELIRR